LHVGRVERDGREGDSNVDVVDGDVDRGEAGLGCARLLEGLAQLRRGAAELDGAVVVVLVGGGARGATKPHERVGALVPAPLRLGGLERPRDVFGVRVACRRNPGHRSVGNAIRERRAWEKSRAVRR